jgi:hypothetical protein
MLPPQTAGLIKEGDRKAAEARREQRRREDDSTMMSQKEERRDKRSRRSVKYRQQRSVYINLYLLASQRFSGMTAALCNRCRVRQSGAAPQCGYAMATYSRISVRNVVHRNAFPAGYCRRELRKISRYHNGRKLEKTR